MVTRQVIIDEARSWLDTPFQHQSHRKGLGCDCGGLIGGICIGAGLFPADWWETSFASHSGYARTPSNGTLEAICHLFMRRIPLAEAKPADVLLMRFKQEPQHLAILVPYRYGGLEMIHAYSRAGKVVGHRFADVWRARVVEAFALLGVI